MNNSTTSKIISVLFVILFGSASTISASHLTASYQVIPTYSSYTYTSGCNTYRYDPYYKTSTLLYSSCRYNYSTASSYYNYSNTYYEEYTYPVTYSYPTYNYANYNRCGYNPYPAINWFDCYGGSYGYTYDYYTGTYSGGKPNYNYNPYSYSPTSCYYDSYGYLSCY